MSITDKSLMEAVQKLRKAFDMTQIQFAKVIGKSYPMVQRYEKQVPPSDRPTLARLMVLANKQSDLENLFELFRQAYLDTMSSEELSAIAMVFRNSIFTSPGPIDSLDLPTEAQPYVETFLYLWQRRDEDEQFADILSNITSALKPYVKKAAAAQAQKARNRPESETAQRRKII